MRTNGRRGSARGSGSTFHSSHDIFDTQAVCGYGVLGFSGIVIVEGVPGFKALLYIQLPHDTKEISPFLTRHPTVKQRPPLVYPI
jgi:hypothetical protein